MKSHQSPTLSDVARAARVGTTTVSRVINGGQRVSPDTLIRVRKVIDKLGYVPNQAARVLRGERTKTVGLIVPSIADSFFSSCTEAAQAIARAHDSLLVVTVTNNDPHVELENINLLMRRTDGLLLTPANSQSESLAGLLQNLTIPTVCIDRPVEHSGTPSVVTNNFEGAVSAIEHLVGHGYKRILCLGGETTLYTIQERVRGYRHAIQQAGLRVMVETSPSVLDYKGVEKVITSSMAGPNPPDAIFTLKNLTTIYAFEVLQKLRIRIPDTVALLGFDDFDLASALRPSISVVQQPVEDIGRIAAELLFNKLFSAKKSPAKKRTAEQVRLETRLVLRNSCGCNPSS